MQDRRELLASLGTISAVAIAGCSGGGNNGGSTEGDSQNSGNEDSDGEAGTDENSGNTSSDGGDENDSSETEGSTTSHTPTSVVRQFWEAIIEENYENANELLHPGSLNYPLDESNVSISGQEVESVEEVTYDEASDIIALASKEDFDEAIQDATGATEYTLVHTSFTDDGDGITPVVEQDGELLAVWLR